VTVTVNPATSGASDGSSTPEERITEALLGVLERSTSPDAIEAQNLILRRLALEGNVIPSRVPPPRNITEIGGYLNLLGTLGEAGTRSQVLASVLGVAGTGPPPGWVTNTPPALSFVAITNDRPVGPAQPAIPITVGIRSDFVGPLQGALKTARDLGCLVPLQGGPVALPTTGPASGPPIDPLPYLGRMIAFPSGSALVAPATDALVLARPATSTAEFAIAAVARGTGADRVTVAAYEALVCTDKACSTVTLPAAALVPLGPLLASAGFYPSGFRPTTSKDTHWTRARNITGLVAGTTRLGDELDLLYPASAIAASVFAGAVDRVWDGSSFAAV